MLRQSDAKVFQKYSQMKLKMKRGPLGKTERKANEPEGAVQEPYPEFFLLTYLVLESDRSLLAEEEHLLSACANYFGHGSPNRAQAIKDKVAEHIKDQEIAERVGEEIARR